jgi:hypothetical protein
MSHFTVMVIGHDHDEQLAPFHEFECTGLNNQYVQDIDITDEIRKLMEDDYKDSDDPLTEALEYHGLEDRIVESEDEIDRDDDHKYGYAIVRDGKLIKAVDRTNPNRKWDWYQVGGRWTGMLKLKDGANGIKGTPGLMTSPAETGRADMAFKRDVDWEGMRDEAGEKAGALWDQVRAVAPNVWESWDSIRSRVSDIDQARDTYHSQPGRKAIRKAEDRSLMWVEDSILCSRDEYIQKARDAACTTFAVLKDGTWYERGSMGWWGMVSDEEDRDTWNTKVSEMIDGLPDDTLITIVDCHI